MLATHRQRIFSLAQTRGRFFSNALNPPTQSFVDARFSPSNFHPDSAVVYSSFITEDEGESLMADVTQKLRRKRYEKGHWDSVITGYKEAEMLHPEDLVLPKMDNKDQEMSSVQLQQNLNLPALLSEVSLNAIANIRRHIETNHILNLKSVAVDSNAKDFNAAVKWLPCHAIDLKKDGELTAHVDSIKFSGEIVAGLSLLSSSIMRLRPASVEDKQTDAENTKEQGSSSSDQSGEHIDLFLPPLSLYVLSAGARYSYTHELLPCSSVFHLEEGNDVNIRRERRVSIIFRDTK